MPYGEVLGNTYLLPQQRYTPDPALAQAGSAAQPAMQSSFQLPETQIGDLDLAEGLADQFYDTKGQIRAFALDMQNRGIDVTTPDYSQPGGGLPFKTYQKMATNLQLTADRLTQSRKEHVSQADALRKGEIKLEPGFDPSQQLSDKSPEEMFFSTKLLPEVEQANAIFRQPVKTAADQARRQTLYDQTVAGIEARTDLTPAQKYFQKEALVLASQETQQFPPQRDNPYDDFTMGQRLKLEGYDVFLRDVNNQLSGRWSDYKKSTDTEGKPVAESERFAGEQLGQYRIADSKTGGTRYVPRVIDRWIKYPDGSTYITFANTDDGQEIPPMKVNDRDALGLATEIVASNPKYGDAVGLREAAVMKGYIGPKEATIKRERLDDPTLTPVDMSSYEPMIKAEEDKIRKELAPLTPDGIKKPPSQVSYRVGDKLITFKQHKAFWRDGWYVEGVEGKEQMNDDEVVKYLKEEGYFDKVFDEQATPVAETPAATPQAEDDFNTKWATLKSGEKLVGPDGKTYVKK